ncbi:signal peptidase I [Gordonia sp. 852002-50395_SCH5434458]|uniref:signal peptidase I n=1 Tax=Gordonia sp. 852002-50395_SCH5434458 TaxID=1834090 RepID=UPI0007EAD60A|nr:signal peptidase I [Gordonia sp. 852002-50395_SCH5434458]OBC08292.1 signal peptidase I [Gordonia sp. 852002-50395_SCH5434458]
MASEHSAANHSDADDAHSSPADPVDGRSEDSEERPWRTKDDDDEPKRKRGSWLRETIIIVACVLLVTWILQTFIGRQYVIPSESMESTLIGCQGCTNDRIVIDKLAYRFGDPEPGDVVVFRAPTSSWDGDWESPRSNNPVVHGLQNGLSWFGFAPPDENDLVKRVIATGGQTVECRNAEGVGVKVNGKPLNEPYIDKSLQSRDVASGQSGEPDNQVTSCYGPDFGPIKVPDGNLWVMGDNREYSADSRYHVTDELQGTVPVSDVRGKVRFIIYPVSRIGGVGSINPQQ